MIVRPIYRFMNITLELQQLDDLIVAHTHPPVTAILRNKLHPLRDQLEAYIAEEQQRTKLLADTQTEHAALKDSHAKLQAETARRDSEAGDGYYVLKP